MQKAIECAKYLSKKSTDNNSEYLEEINLKNVFEGIYNLGFPTVDENRLISFVIFAYDPDSQKLDIRKDRYENKVSIMSNIGIDVSNELMQEILSNSNEKFNHVVLLYLHELTDWRWLQIYSYLDYHSNMIRFANQKTEEERKYDKMNKEGIIKELTEEYDIETIAKINKNKGELLNLAMDARHKADLLLEEIRKSFVSTDHAVQQDFGFTFTETAKKPVDILSWRLFIKELNEKKKLS
jgi:DNA segregation ATPase FtsK/SpoIIIE-like protein